MSSRFGALEIILLVVITLGVGACYPLIKIGLSFAPPLLFAGIRTLIGGGILIGVLLALRRPILPASIHWAWLPFFSLVATSLTFGSMFMSPFYAAAGIGAVLGNLQPLVIIALAAYAFCERVTLRKGIAVGLGFGGALVLSGGSMGKENVHAIHGAGLALLSSVSGAVASVWVRHLKLGAELLSVTGWQLLLGSLPLIGLSAVLESDEPLQWSLKFIGLLLFLAFFGTALTTLGWFWLLGRHEAGRLGLGLFLVPVFGLLSSVFIHGEGVEVIDGVGIGLILAGIALALTKRPWGIE